MEKKKPFLTKWPFLFKLRLFFFVFGLALVLSFLYLKFLPFGHASYSANYPVHFRSGKGFISSFTPAERIEESDDYPKVIGDPAYFYLFTPRAFDQAKVTITYRARLSSSSPLVELGVLKDKEAENYELKPVENRNFDSLDSEWVKIKEGGVTLWQKGKRYDNLAAFQKDLEFGRLKDCQASPTSCLAVYNYDARFPYQVSGASSGPSLIIDQPLRGEHQFYIYVPSHQLHLNFSFLDMNRDKERDDVAVNLYSIDGWLDSRFLADDNPAPTSGQAEEKNISLVEDSLSPGVYRVEVKINKDVIIKRIESSSSQVSFINHLWPVAGPGPLVVYTDRSYLLAKTLSPASLQEISFNRQKFSLNMAYRQFDFSVSDKTVGPKEIRLANDDVVLENGGVFSFSRNGLINPSLQKVDSYLDLSNIKYILTEYQRPEEKDGWRTATADFSLVGAARDKGRYRFLISIPGLNMNGEKDYLEIKSIGVEVSGRTVWDKIKSWYE